MDKFVLVINSTDYYQRFSSVNDQVYIMNNTNIPSGNYRCRWTFRGASEPTANVGVYPTIYLRSSTTQQAYSVGSTGGNQISYCLGSPIQTPTAYGTSYHRCGPYDNTAFYWNYNPSSEIRITLRADVSNALYAGSSNYIMMIEMERLVDEDD